jgi:hypothetical protein
MAGDMEIMQSDGLGFETEATLEIPPLLLGKT